MLNQYFYSFHWIVCPFVCHKSDKNWCIQCLPSWQTTWVIIQVKLCTAINSQNCHKVNYHSPYMFLYFFQGLCTFIFPWLLLKFPDFPGSGELYFKFPDFPEPVSNLGRSYALITIIWRCMHSNVSHQSAWMLTWRSWWFMTVHQRSQFMTVHQRPLWFMTSSKIIVVHDFIKDHCGSWLH